MRALVQVWVCGAAKGRASRLLCRQKSTVHVAAIVDEIGAAVQVAQRAEQRLTLVRVVEVGAPEHGGAQVGAVLALEAGAAVLHLHLTGVQLGRGEAPDDLAGVQVPAPNKAGLCLADPKNAFGM